MDLTAALRHAVEAGASDVHLVVARHETAARKMPFRSSRSSPSPES
jgi:hypothetical protein